MYLSDDQLTTLPDEIDELKKLVRLLTDLNYRSTTPKIILALFLIYILYPMTVISLNVAISIVRSLKSLDASPQLI